MGVSKSKIETYTLRVSERESKPCPAIIKQPSMQKQLSNLSKQSSFVKPPELISTKQSSFLGKSKIHCEDQPVLKKAVSFSGLRNIACSNDAPWLIKSADFFGAALDCFELSNVIGAGLMGTVQVANIKGKKQYFVMKSIRKDYICRHHDERHIYNERKILMTLKSSFCIKLFGTFQDENRIYLALEFVVGGELFRRLSKKEAFMPQTAKFYATEIFSALNYVQSMGFVYRDLKPENVMLDDEGHCKLVDFGFSREGTENMRTVCGTPAYLSPEQLNGKFTNGYSSIVDWWSFGVFIYELLTGKTPFCKSNRESAYEIFLRILKSKVSFPRNFDPSAKELITALCHAELKDRLVDRDKISKHPYFTIDWTLVSQRRLIPPFIPKLSGECDLHYFDVCAMDAEKPTASEFKVCFENF